MNDKCIYCGGNGYVEPIRGKGTPCAECGGSGKKPIPCSSCAGKGSSDCSNCSGSGEIIDVSVSEDKKTLTEHQRGSCTICNGTGQVKCSACNGTGKIRTK